jgi:hypothetical protein
VRTPTTLEPHNFASRPLKCGLKQNCSFCQKLSNGMSHALWNQVNQVDSQLFLSEVKLAVWFLALLLAITCVLDIQMSKCELILDIYVSRAFQWYKERHKPLHLTPEIASEVSGVHRDSISQSESCLGSVNVHSLTFFHTFLYSQEYVVWLSSFLLARTLTTPLLLVTNPKLGLRHLNSITLFKWPSNINVKNFTILSFTWINM